MATRLVEADRRAVDQILDGQASPPEGQEASTPFDHMSQLQFQQRIATIQRWFDLIGAMPADDPSPELIASTLYRLDQARAAQAADTPAQGPTANPSL